jgi:hypothetical protein
VFILFIVFIQIFSTGLAGLDCGGALLGLM